jgi:hypothetical protein
MFSPGRVAWRAANLRRTEQLNRTAEPAASDLGKKEHSSHGPVRSVNIIDPAQLAFHAFWD